MKKETKSDLSESDLKKFQDAVSEHLGSPMPEEILKMPFEKNYSASREWLNATYEELNKARDILSDDEAVGNLWNKISKEGG